MVSDDGRLPIGVASQHRTWKDKPFTAIAAVVGVESDGPGDFAETLANARLIAAAPELLAALEAISLEACAHDGCEGDSTCSRCEIGRIAKAAIAKARGVS